MDPSAPAPSAAWEMIPLCDALKAKAMECANEYVALRDATARFQRSPRTPRALNTPRGASSSRRNSSVNTPRSVTVTSPPGPGATSTPTPPPATSSAEVSIGEPPVESDDAPATLRELHFAERAARTVVTMREQQLRAHLALLATGARAAASHTTLRRALEVSNETALQYRTQRDALSGAARQQSMERRLSLQRIEALEASYDAETKRAEGFKREVEMMRQAAEQLEQSLRDSLDKDGGLVEDTTTPTNTMPSAPASPQLRLVQRWLSRQPGGSSSRLAIPEEDYESSSSEPTQLTPETSTGAPMPQEHTPSPSACLQDPTPSRAYGSRDVMFPTSSEQHHLVHQVPPAEPPAVPRTPEQGQCPMEAVADAAMLTSPPDALAVTSNPKADGQPSMTLEALSSSLIGGDHGADHNAASPVGLSHTASASHDLEEFARLRERAEAAEAACAKARKMASERALDAQEQRDENRRLHEEVMVLEAKVATAETRRHHAAHGRMAVVRGMAKTEEREGERAMRQRAFAAVQRAPPNDVSLTNLDPALTSTLAEHTKRAIPAALTADVSAIGVAHDDAVSDSTGDDDDGDVVEVTAAAARPRARLEEILGGGKGGDEKVRDDSFEALVFTTVPSAHRTPRVYMGAEPR